jgi:hypothetical protein
MTVKCYYKRNLKMSPAKLAAQVGQAEFSVENKHKES